MVEMLNKTFLIKETNIFFLYLRNENEKFHRRIDMKQKRDLADVHRCCPYGNRPSGKLISPHKSE